VAISNLVQGQNNTATATEDTTRSENLKKPGALYSAFSPDKKWILSSSAAFSTGINSFRGGSSLYYTIPVGLQLNRKITNNLYAFAGIAVAPAYMAFNNQFLSTDPTKYISGYPFSQGNFGLYGRAMVGLMYVNDARTFSISGSFGVQRGAFPYYIPPANPGMNKQATNYQTRKPSIEFY
jgi:hypothetical protein